MYYENNERKGGALGFIRDKFLDPAKGVFEKLVEESRHMFRATGKVIASAFKSVAGFIKDEFRTSALANFIQSSAFGKLIKTAGLIAVSPTMLISGLLKSTNEFLNRRSLTRGYRIRGEDGNILTAAERRQKRFDDGIGYGSKFDLFDKQIEEL